MRKTLTICGNRFLLRIPLTFCGIHLQLRNPEQLVIFACCRQKLRYRYMYAESTETLFVESTHILEHILRLVSGIQEQADTKLCSYSVHSLAS